jgi:trk system potassium uptake protein TrkH
MGLGGFSSHDASLGYFDSPALESRSVVFALIAGINFATHFAGLARRTPACLPARSGMRWFLGFVLISGLGMACCSGSGTSSWIFPGLAI